MPTLCTTLRQHMNTGNVHRRGHSHDKHVPGDSEISLEGFTRMKAITLGRDAEKGLGFTVAEGEQGDKSFVIVTSIVQGGPADQVSKQFGRCVRARA